MIRFLVLAFALLLLLLGVFAFTAETLGWVPSTPQADFGFGRGQLPARTVLGIWTLEALGLIALFLMIQGRWPRWWQDGLVTGWIAWVFRGPLLVLTVAGATHLSPKPWWAMSVRWFLLYSLLGVAVASVGRRLPTGREAPALGNGPEITPVPAAPPEAAEAEETELTPEGGAGAVPEAPAEHLADLPLQEAPVPEPEPPAEREPSPPPLPEEVPGGDEPAR